MGIWDAVKSIAAPAIGGILGGIPGAALSFGGKFLEDAFIGDSNAKDAYKRQQNFYRNRYQWMMEDMRQAGLNPILAAGSAGFSTSGTPSVSMASMPQSDYSSAYQNMMGAEKQKEEATTQKVEQLKKMAEVKTEIQRKVLTRAQIGVAKQEEMRLNAEVQKTWAEVEKIVSAETPMMQTEKELLEKRINEMAYSLVELGKTAEVYDSWIGKALIVLKELAKVFGINIGIVPGIGRRPWGSKQTVTSPKGRTVTRTEYNRKR